MPVNTDQFESAEMMYLRVRISGLEGCIYELLSKNERLRAALSADASLKWTNRTVTKVSQWPHSNS